MSIEEQARQKFEGIFAHMFGTRSDIHFKTYKGDYTHPEVLAFWKMYSAGREQMKLEIEQQHASERATVAAAIRSIDQKEK